MNGSGLLLEVTAPGNVNAFDRFVARSREIAAAWVSWAVTQRTIISSEKLIEAALTGQLIIRVRSLDSLESFDLLRHVSLVLESGEVTRLTSSAGLKTLSKRRKLRPDDALEFRVDARGIVEALPVLTAPAIEHEAVLQLPGLPTLLVGANLLDATEVPIDPDPPPPRVVPLPPSAQPLFERIYANPDDDTLRDVLADALEEAGHPRGRFIRLQLDRARSGKPVTREEERLLEDHEKTWLGDLVRMVWHVRWERGFPIEASIGTHLRGLLSRPEMNTFERLDFCADDRASSPAPVERLTVATSVGLAAMPSFSSGTFTRLTALHCETPGVIRDGIPSEPLLALAHAKGLNQVTWFELEDRLHESDRPDSSFIEFTGRCRDASDFKWLWPTPLGRRLEKFGTKVKLEGIASWLKLAHRLPVPVVLLHVCQYHDQESLWLRLERGSNVLHALWREVPKGFDDRRPTLKLLLAAIENSPFVRVRLEHPKPGEADRKLEGPRLELVEAGPLERFDTLG